MPSYYNKSGPGLPSSSSVSGLALDAAIQAAVNIVLVSDRKAPGEPLLLQTHVACMNARAFAARGVASLFELGEPRKVPHSEVQQILLDAYKTHLIGSGMYGCISQGGQLQSSVVGNAESVKRMVHSEAFEKATSSSKASFVLTELMEELAHAQRVLGYNEAYLMKQFNACYWQQMSMHSMFRRALVRSVSLSEQLPERLRIGLQPLDFARRFAESECHQAALLVLKDISQSCGSESAWELRYELVLAHMRLEQFDAAAGVPSFVEEATMPQNARELLFMVKSWYLHSLATLCSERGRHCAVRSNYVDIYERGIAMAAGSPAEVPVLVSTMQELCRGLLLAYTGSYGDAAWYLGAALGSNVLGDSEPNLQMDALHARAECLFRLGLHSDAIQAYHDTDQRAVYLHGSQSPERIRVRLWLSACHRRMGNILAVVAEVQDFRSKVSSRMIDGRLDILELLREEWLAQAALGDFEQAYLAVDHVLCGVRKLYGEDSRVFAVVSLDRFLYAGKTDREDDAEKSLEAGLPWLTICMEDLGLLDSSDRKRQYWIPD